jgi:hypothetical protein
MHTKHKLDTKNILDVLDNALYIHFVKVIDSITTDIEDVVIDKKPLFSAWFRMGKRLGFQDALS